MSFLDQRDALQHALDSDGDTETFPPVGARIRDARERAALSLDDAAAALGLGFNAYFDLELHDDELFNVVDLAVVPALSSLLGVSPFVLLFGEEPPTAIAATTPSDVAAALVAKTRSEGLTVDELSEQAGWELATLLDDPDVIWHDFTVAGANDVCRVIGLDWLGLLVLPPDNRTSAST